MIVIRSKRHDEGNEFNNGPLMLETRPAADLEHIVEILRGNNFFSEFSPRQLRDLAGSFAFRQIHAGFKICRQGDAGDAIYVVADGEVEVVRENGGFEEILHVAGPGELLGEVAVQGDVPRTASLRARNHVRYIQINGGDFISLLSLNPDMSIKVIRMMVRRLADDLARS